MQTIKINDVTVRDGNQSLLATRMEHEDILKILAEMDKVGLNALEVWGGATFDGALRFFKRSPWQNLRDMKRVAPNTPFSMLLRGQNIVGYHHYDNDTLERFIRLSLENGIDIIRVFDALNDIENVKNAIYFIKKHGGHCQGAISYTVSPVHNIDYYVTYAKQLVDAGADSICIKDMAGILLPDVTFELVKRLKDELNVPINLHSHATTGLSSLVFEQAMKAGVDIVDGCISPFSNGTSHIALETLLETAHVTNRETTITHTALQGAYEEANELATKYIASGQYPAKALMINPNILTYQVPGGMLSNLMSQLKDQGASDRYEEVLKEIPKVREDLGYPPLVTPLSQMVGTQAVLNVLTGTRYKMVPKEIKDYAMGLYGTFPGPVNEDVINLILKDEKRVEKQPVESMPSVFEANKVELEAKLGREALEEEVLSYILFPQNAILEGEEPKARPDVIEFKMFDGGETI
ncbi:pyruvate carboxylase subunit B [Erysipelothrix rhusiopathiae]|uniref:Oxaloacetate decarboxylase subunit alpha n=1 Tax=Erysipelothrix piscisicarius TaxID=2485784 RepID=A0A3S8RNF1_9FIRM|nr:pyruvate carboxylase subunit B [Erysipelothrix piscisicarius]AZK44409.1 oxaloacetate decarboxylase subunit alpha [Erysipelothrix piscisicarius]NBA00762.1 pyruvate carboxylase subunit B [Erysipelothrix rhusiopathiae]